MRICNFHIDYANHLIIMRLDFNIRINKELIATETIVLIINYIRIDKRE